MRSCSLWPSVRLPHSCIASKRLPGKRIIKLFPLSGSHTNLIVPYQTSWQYSDGYPLTGGIECRWGRQNSRLTQLDVELRRRVATDTSPTQLDVKLCRYKRAFSDLVYHSMRHIRLVRRTEQNLFVRSGKSKAEVTNNKIAFDDCTIKAN